MKTKPKTPYHHLMRDAMKFANEVQYAHTRNMWRYPKADLEKNYKLDDLTERVGAAEQLGYDVVLVNENGDLVVRYRKKPPTRPMGWAWP